MPEVIPAIMPMNREEIQNAVHRYVDTNIQTIQLDLMDGEYVQAKTWPYKSSNQYEEYKKLKKDGFPGWQDIDIELDLMVQNPLKDMENFIEYGPSRIIVHAGTFEINDFLNFLEKHKNVRSFIHFGIAFHVDDTIQEYAELIEHIDFVQCMGIAEIGKQGELFDDRVLHQIDTLLQINPKLIISVDGGVNPETSQQLIHAGVKRIVSGSFLSNCDDVNSGIRKLLSL